MNRQILVVNHGLPIADLTSSIPRHYHLVNVTRGMEGLTLLGKSDGWGIVMAPFTLPDMEGISFLKEAAALSGAIPLLLTHDDTAVTALQQANSRSLFRVIPMSTPHKILRDILRDADDQYQLVQQELLLREKVELLSITDPLTGCYSRSYLQEHLSKELRRSIRYSHSLSVILCDIDALREVNDAYGYQVGDELLIGFAQLARQSLRQGIDTVTRWGEDEFLILLPETHIRGAGRVASRLQEQFVGLACQTSQGQTINATISFGIAGFAPETPHRNTLADQLLLIANRCLMQAKAAGGSQILCCP